MIFCTEYSLTCEMLCLPALFIFNFLHVPKHLEILKYMFTINTELIVMFLHESRTGQELKCTQKQEHIVALDGFMFVK